MPYIKQEDRSYFDSHIQHLADILKTSTNEDKQGELNYIFTKLLMLTYPKAKYNEYNSAIGVLECCKQEFYRRIVAPYEDIKKKENGDVH